ncbi:replication initiation protein, partial [Staphylococcus aureus]
KYSDKDRDYLVNQRVFSTFFKSLKGKQILVYSGLFKEARKKLKNGDLDYLKEVDPTESVSYTHLRAHETTLHLVCRLLLEKKKK